MRLHLERHHWSNLEVHAHNERHLQRSTKSRHGGRGHCRKSPKTYLKFGLPRWAGQRFAAAGADLTHGYRSSLEAQGDPAFQRVSLGQAK
eukprot:418702-Pelagomonas_calceolata.AAC.7